MAISDFFYLFPPTNTILMFELDSEKMDWH